MRTIAYDPSRTALYHPESGETVLKAGAHNSDDLLCAEAARLVYKRFESSPSAAQEIEQALGSVGFDRIDFFDREGAQFFAAANPSRATAIVSFRGTTRGLGDILTDLKTWPKNWRAGGRVHAGFCDAFERHHADLSSWLAAHRERSIVTGHSLGGALATLAASVFKPARLVTFGTPRVGDHEFARTLNDVDCLRYVDCCDIVTRLPPEVLGFRHCGKLRYIDRSGTIHIDPTADLMKEDSRPARSEYFHDHALRPGAVKLRDLADHAPINYIYPVLALDDLRPTRELPSTIDPTLL